MVSDILTEVDENVYIVSLTQDQRLNVKDWNNTKKKVSDRALNARIAQVIYKGM